MCRALRLCDALLELGWLVAIIAIPLYFNVDDVRAFEPDKAILLRDLAALLASFALLHLTLHTLATPPQRTGRRRPHPEPPGGAQPSPLHRPRSAYVCHRGTRLRVAAVAGRPAVSAHVAAGSPPRLPPFAAAVLHRYPILLPMLALTATTLLATATSILPRISWHGSYARGQGALTTLAYLAVALVMLACLRRPQQAERLATATALSGVAPAGYGWVQHFGRDPLPWQQPDLTARVPGTMGNPIFLGALLVMTLPFALYRLARALQLFPGARLSATGACSSDRGRRGACHPTAVGGVALWSLVVLGEAGALLFTKSRGPFAGALVATAVCSLSLATAWRLPWLRWLTLGASALAVAALLGATLLAGRALGPIRETSSLRLVQWSPAASGTAEVRLDIWGPALQLVVRRPLLGCGPDVLQFCYYPVYPTALRHIEAPNAVPDRTHNMFLDAAVETGLLGLAALLALLASTAWTLWRLLTQATDPSRRALAAALLAALLGHLTEGCVGIAIVATSLLTWLLAAAASSLAAMEVAERGMATGADVARTAPDGPTGAGVSHVGHAMSAQVGTARPRPVGHDRGRRPAPAKGAPGRRWPQRAAGGLLCLVCLGLALPMTWALWQDGAQATAADVAARQAAGLEQVALGNSGQAPVPAGVRPQPILALRQFAAAVTDQKTAIRQAPDPAAREEYLLDGGILLVEWAQAATQVGGSAAVQAADLYVQALSDFGQAARLNPYNPDHLRNTGKAYERWAGLGHDPNQPATWNQALLARAAEAFTRAAQLAPRHPDPLTSWAEVAIWQGNARQAQTLLARALALDPRDGDAYRLRAKVELAQGRRMAALADWRRALADPDASHVGETAAQLALAEATWAHQRCPAVRDARTALGESDTPDPTTMREIVHVDGPRCPS